MALWQLIVAGVESTARGTVSWLVKQGRSLLAKSTAEEATGRVINQMSITDPEDTTLTRQIVGEQVQGIHAANVITRQGQLPPGLQEPVMMTFPSGATEEYRYQVVVVETDPSTGKRNEHFIEVYSNDRLDRQSILNRAVDAVENGLTPLSPPGGIDDGAVTVITRTAIVSAGKRG